MKLTGVRTMQLTVSFEEMNNDIRKRQMFRQGTSASFGAYAEVEHRKIYGIEE